MKKLSTIVLGLAVVVLAVLLLRTQSVLSNVRVNLHTMDSLCARNQEGWKHDQAEWSKTLDQLKICTASREWDNEAIRRFVKLYGWEGVGYIPKVKP